MAQPLVDHLRFTRSERHRALRGIPEADGLRHVGPMNLIGWISLQPMGRAWRAVITAADGPLDSLDDAAMHRPLPGSPRRLAGDAIQRVTYHYWFHIGEILAIRQVLEHPARPEFVGDLDHRASYRSRP